jgi:hypothetical protein
MEQFTLDGVTRNTEDLTPEQRSTLEQLQFTQLMSQSLKVAFDALAEDLRVSLTLTDSMTDHAPEGIIVPDHVN